MFNGLQVLQSFGLAQQIAERRRQAEREDYKAQREIAGREALADHLLASRPASRVGAPGAGAPQFSTAAQLANIGMPALSPPAPTATTPAPAAPSATAALMDVGSAAANPFATAAPPVPAQARTRSPQDMAFERLARIDPETAYKVQKLDAQQRTEMAESFGKQMDVSGRVMSAVMAAPEDQRAAIYQRYLPTLKAQGIFHLPDEWDPAQATADMRTGMTVLQALGADRQDRRLDWDIQDDEYDNERADQDLGSRMEYREGQLSNTQRGQDLAHERGLRGQDLANSRGIRGQDLTNERTIRGQDLTDSRTRRGQDLTDTRTRRGQDMTDRRTRESASFRGVGGKRGGAGASTARIVNPQTGQAMVLQNGKWVPEK